MGDVAELRPAGGRVPPHDLDAEAAVLSAIFADSTRLYDAQALIAERDFYSNSNRFVWRAIESLERDGGKVDTVTVATWLRDHALLEPTGGTPYLLQLTDATPAVAHIREHARAVAEKALRRRLIATFQTLSAEGYEPIADGYQWAQDAEARVYETARMRGEDETDNTLRGLVSGVYDAMSKRARGEEDGPGLPTGWSGLDARIGGWRPKVYVVGGRPGMGKSAFVTQACVNVADQGLAAVLVTLEQDREEVATRIVAQESKIDFTVLESGKLREADWADATKAAEFLQKLPMSIRKEPGATVAKIRTCVRQELSRLRRVHGTELRLGMVCVDYAQLVNGERQKGESRDGELTRISKELQWLTGEFECTVVVVVQLNRDVEKRDNKRPQLSDIRESGAFEQDAYGVFFPFREAYYDPARKHDRVQDSELIIAKHRNGSLPTVRFAFTAPCMRFDVAAEDCQDDPQATLDPSWKTRPRRETLDHDIDDGRYGG